MSFVIFQVDWITCRQAPVASGYFNFWTAVSCCRVWDRNISLLQDVSH